MEEGRSVDEANDRSSIIALMCSRRSGLARDMIAPGPDAAQLDRILSAAVSVPDHGKLTPWHFVIIEPAQRMRLADELAKIHAAENPDAREHEREKVRKFALQAPTLIIVLLRPARQSRIAHSAQFASAAAAAMTLAYATHAEGFVCSWLSGWAAYSSKVAALVGQPGDSIVGFMFIGTPSRQLLAQPRPGLADKVSVWRPDDIV